MGLWSDLKREGAAALGQVRAEARRSIAREVNEAREKLAPGIAADVRAGLSGIFRKVKARVADQAAATPLAQEVKAREIEKALPTIALAGAALFLLGILVAAWRRG